MDTVSPPDKDEVERASRAFLEAARAIGETENGVVDRRPYESIDPAERDQLERCIMAAIAAMSPVDRLRERTNDLQLALDVALKWLGPREPGDSRAVSDEFVSMAAAACDCMNDEARDILRAALSSPEPVGEA